MASDRLRFDRFCLDLRERRLTCDGETVALNSRYLEALALLVSEDGRLVTKDRFMAEVWRGVPVTDEALTQCIRTLRRALGDEAGRPRFIETAPKHGYRFIAPVERVGAGVAAPANAADWAPVGALTARAALAGGAAGAVGGLCYGGAAASGMGGASVLLVLVCLTVVVGVIGAAGAGLGVGGARLVVGRAGAFDILGGAAGGFVVGGLFKLIGADAFELLFGRSPGAITGAPEGAVLGAAVGLVAWLALLWPRGRSVLAAAGTGFAAGGLIVLAGGRLMGGSLASVAAAFPASRLRLDRIGDLFGEAGFGRLSQISTGALEGALFVGGVALALSFVRRP